MAKHLLICVGLGDLERRGNGRAGTYFLPVASHPSVMRALCPLARPSLGGTLANVAHVVPDPSGAFKSAVNLSVLSPDTAGRRALDKHTENTRVINTADSKDPGAPNNVYCTTCAFYFGLSDLLVILNG